MARRTRANASVCPDRSREGSLLHQLLKQILRALKRVREVRRRVLGEKVQPATSMRYRCGIVLMDHPEFAAQAE